MNMNSDVPKPVLVSGLILLSGFLVFGLISSAINRVQQESEQTESRNAPTPVPTPTPTPQQVANAKKAQAKRDKEAKEFQKKLDIQRAQEAKKAQERLDSEIDFNGLVFLKKKEKWDEEEYGTRYITGIVENRTGRDLSYASIKYKIFDKSGEEVVETPFDNIGGIANGEKWRFRVHVMYDKALRYSVDSVEGVG